MDIVEDGMMLVVSEDDHPNEANNPTEDSKSTDRTVTSPTAEILYLIFSTTDTGHGYRLLIPSGSETHTYEFQIHISGHDTLE